MIMEKAIRVLIIILLTGTVFSCTVTEAEESIDRKPFKATPLEKAYSTFRPQVQTFELDNDEAITITAKGGTEIFIPSECFIDNNGKDVSGPIQIEIIEALTMSDFVASGLATLSDSLLLLSNGMLYIDAKLKGSSVRIKNGTKLTASMPTIGNNTGFQMFVGDGKNWAVDSSMLEEDYLIPIPLELLYPEGNKWLRYCWRADESIIAYYDTTIIDFTNRAYENTVLATREFQARTGVLLGMMHQMSYFESRDYYFDKWDCFDQRFNYDIWKVYYDNPSKPLWYLDAIAKSVFETYFRQNQEKIAAFCADVNEHKRNHYQNWSDTNYFFDFRGSTLEEWFLSPLNNFPNDTPKDLKIIDDYGVDLNEDNAYEKLISLGVSSNEANLILQYNFRRQSILEQLEREANAISDQNYLREIYNSTVFSIKQLGWINCDLFYEDPNSGKAEILLADKSDHDLDFIDFSLVIPDMNVRLMSFPRDKNLYSFTKENGPYTKLPMDKNAVVIGVSIKNDSVFFASKAIKIMDGLNLDLEMSHIPTESLNDSLQIALSIAPM